jgi:hypothetical protein
MRLRVPVILKEWDVAWTHDARWRWATPSPSKENETPGTGDLEGRSSPRRIKPSLFSLADRRQNPSPVSFGVQAASLLRGYKGR